MSAKKELIDFPVNRQERLDHFMCVTLQEIVNELNEIKAVLKGQLPDAKETVTAEVVTKAELEKVKVSDKDIEALKPKTRKKRTPKKKEE